MLGQFTHTYAAFTGNTTPYLPTTFNSLSNATQGTAALAYRPLKSDRAEILFSYTQTQISGVPNFQNDNVGLLSTDGYFQAARNLEFYGKVALSLAIAPLGWVMLHSGMRTPFRDANAIPSIDAPALGIGACHAVLAVQTATLIDMHGCVAHRKQYHAFIRKPPV
ncbi:MAG TPA: hypothetical protein VFK06_02675 [Candidatus Angelobacter sp.]|nr:hypothetical protein [Candidatus Angelobacter sp.]